jgi:inosine-uridine nucleoside N-ribohydrolase
MPKSVILDADTGIDDALAIILLTRSPEIELRAITAVSGNVPVDKTSLNALKILAALKIKTVPVARGLGKPLLRDLNSAEEFHGTDGLGNSNLPLPEQGLDTRHAVDLLLEETSRSPGHITLIATGPLTNIATALVREPSLARNVRELVIMGGAYGLTPYGYGNTNSVAEYNLFVDPEAASIVFRSGIPLTAVGLDVTADPTSAINERIFQRIKQATSDASRLVCLLISQLMVKYHIFHVHDPMAAAMAIDRSLFKTQKYHVDIETISPLTRGQSIVDRRDWLPQESKRPPNAEVCVSVDGPRLLNLFMDRIGVT